jgi:hypothetical protein
VRFSQFAQRKAWVIAPGNGSEHFAQNGAVIRWARCWQSAHKYSGRLMFAEQTTHVAG